MKSGHAKRERGAALILFAAILVLGVAWFALGALGKAAPSAAQREIKTGEALQAAKKALLGYIAQYAARTDHDVPGRLPCPEPLSPAAGDEGEAATNCSNSTTKMGRLPWRTLGIDQPRDGYGETLWYVLGPGFRSSPINFDTVGGLELDDVPNAAVALIIAPGLAVNTLSTPGPVPAECIAVNQQPNRYALPFDPAKFLECGNEGTGEFKAVATAPWSNDRVLAVTAAEVMDAIAGPVADRLQRTVAPALATWRETDSEVNWGIKFMSYASPFSNPALNNLQGSLGLNEGMPPFVRKADFPSFTAWDNGGITLVVGSGASGGCGDNAGVFQCQATSDGTLQKVQITATAPNVTRAFRAKITAADITSDQGGTVSNLSQTISTITWKASLSFDVSFPTLANGQQVTIRVQGLQDAPIFSNLDLNWYFANNWHRHTYYAIAPAARASPTAACALPGDPGCLVVNKLPASTGNVNDKLFALVLMGRPLAGQSRAGAGADNVANFLELQNASTGDRTFVADRVDNLINDRVATCPFRLTSQSGIVTICN